MDILRAKTPWELQKFAEKYLQDLINVEKVVVWFNDNEKSTMWRFSDNTDKIRRISNQLGILGLVIKTGEKAVVVDPSYNNYYNISADVNTELPIITMPIKDSADFMVFFFAKVYR